MSNTTDALEDTASGTAVDTPLDTGNVHALSFDASMIPISEPRRFTSLALGVFSCICCSTVFCFSLVSSELQQKFQFTQDSISSINTVGLIFCYFALPYGALFDWLGPRPLNLLAATFLPVGSLCFALVFLDVIPGNVVALSVFNGVMGAGVMMYDLGAAVPLLSLFPTRRGAVVAVVKSFSGLGVAVIGSIQLGFFERRPDRYFFFLMASGLVVGTLAFFIFKLPPYHLTDYEKKHLSKEKKERRLRTQALYLTQDPPTAPFMFGVTLTIIAILYLPLQSALIAYLNLGHVYKRSFAIGIIVLLMLFPLMPIALYLRKQYSKKVQLKGNEGMNSAGAAVNGSDVLAEEGNIEMNQPDYVAAVCTGDDGDDDDDGKKEIKTDVDYIAPQYQTTFLQSLCTVRLWAIFWAIFAIFGTELVFIANANFIFAALSEKPVDRSLNTLLAVLNGVGSGVGRMLMSGLEVWSQKRSAEDRIPITIALFFPTVSIIIAVVLFVTLPPAALPLPYFISAVGNGFGAAIIILVTRTIFAKDVAKHYNFCYVAVMVSVILLNRLAYGEWYTRQAAKQGSKICFGKSCVLMPMLLFLGINVTAFISNVYVHVEYRRFCLKVLEEQRQLKEKARMELRIPDEQIEISHEVFSEEGGHRQ